MIEKERSPALRRRSSSPRHVLGDRGLADIDAELEEFSMDAWSAPERIGKTDLPDQPPNFRRDAWPAGTPTRFPAPEGAEACAMPSDNCFRLYDSERVQNTRRDPIQANEDHTIEVAEDRAPRCCSTQHIQLVAQSEYLRLERGLRPKQSQEHPPD